MSALYSYNTLGYGTSKYQTGLDSGILPEPEKEAGFFDGMWEGVKDIPGAVWHSTVAAGQSALSTVMRSEANEDESGFTLDDALTDEDILKADDIKKKASDQLEGYAKERRRIVREDYTPKPETTGFAGQLIYGFGVMAGKQISYSVLTGSPLGGAALTGLDYGINEAGNLRDKGVDAKTAFKAGATTTVLTGVGLALPAAAPAGKLNPNRWSSAAWMAGANAATDSGEKGLINYILTNANYDHIAREYDAFDPIGLTASGGLGGILGAIFFNANRKIRYRPTKKTTETAPVPTAPLNLDTDTLQSLQNRDRGTTSSVLQMRSISASPDYDRLRTSPLLTEGAPVITYAEDIPSQHLGYEDTATAADGTKYKVRYAVVEADSVLTSNDINGSKNHAYTDPNIRGARAIAGNGRITGLKEAYAQGTADSYKSDLAGDQRKTGIYGDTVNAMEKPILVRILDPNDVTKNLADKSNTSGVSRMSLRERAKNDAARIDLEKLEFKEDGGITNDTVIGFVRQLPAEEQAELLVNNVPNGPARDRVEAAIFAKAYDNDTLISQVAEVDKPEASLVLKALMKLAPKVAQLAGSEFDFAPSLIRAAAKIMEGYKQGFRLREIAAQREFDGDPIADAVVDLFAKDARTNRQVVEVLSDVIDALRSSAEGGDMFGGTITRDDVLNTLRSKIGDRYPTPSEPVVDAARTKQLADTINQDQLVSAKGGDVNESIANEQKAMAQVDEGERVSVNEQAVDQERVEAEKKAVIDAMHSVMEEAKGDPLEILARIEPEDVQGMTIRRGKFKGLNENVELGSDFGLVKILVKHIKGEIDALRVTDADLRMIPEIVRDYELSLPRHPKDDHRTWRIADPRNAERELVLVDEGKKVEGERTLLSFYIQNPATRGSGRAKNAPLSKRRVKRNPAGESAYPPADTAARLPLLSSRPSGSPDGKGVTTQSPLDYQTKNPAPEFTTPGADTTRAPSNVGSRSSASLNGEGVTTRGLDSAQTLSEWRDGASVPEAANPNTEITRAPSNVSSRASGPHNGGELTTRGSDEAQNPPSGLITPLGDTQNAPSNIGSRAPDTSNQGVTTSGLGYTKDPADDLTLSPADTTRVPSNIGSRSSFPSDDGLSNTTRGPGEVNLPDQSPESQLIESLPEQIREPVQKVMDLFAGGEEKAEAPTEPIAREFSTDAMFQKALEEHPDMKMIFEDKDAPEISAKDYLDREDLFAKDIEKDGNAQGEAMMCVFQNKGL